MTINSADYQELKNQINSAIIETLSNAEHNDVADTIIKTVCRAMGQEVEITQ